MFKNNQELIDFAKTHTLDETVEKYGLTKRWLLILCKRYNFKCVRKNGRKHYGKTGGKADMILCLVNNDFTYASIGEAFGVTRQQIWNVVQQAKKAEK